MSNFNVDNNFILCSTKNTSLAVRFSVFDRWGIYDVDDCCSGAMSLAAPEDGSPPKVDKDKLCIDGGSAGGYTTLACLTFRDAFKAGKTAPRPRWTRTSYV